MGVQDPLVFLGETLEASTWDESPLELLEQKLADASFPKCINPTENEVRLAMRMEDNDYRDYLQTQDSIQEVDRVS